MYKTTMYGCLVDNNILFRNSTLSLGYLQKQPSNWTFTVNNIVQIQYVQAECTKEIVTT